MYIQINELSTSIIYLSSRFLRLKRLNYWRNSINVIKVLNEKAGLSPQMSIIWALVITTSPKGWLHMQ